MRRVQKMVPQAADIMIMDASSNLDRSSSKLFHLMCPAAPGALPLTVMITTREDAQTIAFGLDLLKKILPPYAFYNRGPALGPSLGE